MLHEQEMVGRPSLFLHHAHSTIRVSKVFRGFPKFSKVYKYVLGFSKAFQRCSEDVQRCTEVSKRFSEVVSDVSSGVHRCSEVTNSFFVSGNL